MTSTLDTVANILGSLKQAQTLIDELRRRGLAIVAQSDICFMTHKSCTQNCGNTCNLYLEGRLDD